MHTYDYMYNISVIGPEEDEHRGHENALHLHHGFGHHTASTSGDVNHECGGNRSFSSDPHPSIESNRPHLPQLTTDFRSPPIMRPPANYPPVASQGYSHPSILTYTADGINTNFPPSWVPVNEMYFDPHSPSNYDQNIESSPNTSRSPLQPPLTPILSVDHSPSSPLPSPGSQGSGGSLNPSPSPHLLSHPLTPASAHGSHLSLDRTQDIPAIMRSSPNPQYMGLRPDQYMHSQYNMVYGNENNTATAQGHYGQPLTYTGQTVTSCGLDVQGVPQMPYTYIPDHSYNGSTYSPANTSSGLETVNYNTSVHRYPSPQLSSQPIPSPAAEVLGPFVPQRVYKPNTASDRRRYVEHADLEQPIMFEMQDPRQEGFPLRDAMQSRFLRLKDRDDLMFIERGPSISVRLVWEGYQPWSRQIPTRDFKSPPGPVTRQKLAKNLAKTISRFIDEHTTSQFDPSADSRWKVGPGRITLDDLALVSLHHVSMGSWQANLRLLRPFAS